MCRIRTLYSHRWKSKYQKKKNLPTEDWLFFQHGCNFTTSTLIKVYMHEKCARWVSECFTALQQPKGGDGIANIPWTPFRKVGGPLTPWPRASAVYESGHELKLCTQWFFYRIQALMTLIVEAPLNSHSLFHSRMSATIFNLSVALGPAKWWASCWVISLAR